MKNCNENKEFFIREEGFEWIGETFQFNEDFMRNYAHTHINTLTHTHTKLKTSVKSQVSIDKSA